MRYTLATGEPVFTGFMRTRPSSTWWAWFYSVLYFLQSGWPAWAANAAGAVYFLFARRLAGPADATVVYQIGVATFLACVVVLLVGRRIERTLELFNWVLIAGHPQQLSRAGARVRARADLGVGGRRPGGLRHRRRTSSAWCPRAWTGFCWRRSSRIRGRRDHERDALELGARPRLRHGRARRLHSRGGRRTEGQPRALGLHVRADRGQRPALARMVADRARRSVGCVFPGRPSRHGAPGAVVRHVSAARH